MKKVLFTTGIAVLALATIVGAQGYVFSTNLTVGSTGADVVALQTWLIAQGYSIPAITSGAAQKGYFGSQTKSAVAAYQAHVGLPSFGFFGPLTRAMLNGTSGGTAMYPASCPTGYTCTQNVPVAVSCPLGYTCTLNGLAPGPGTGVSGNLPGISTPGVPGIMTVTSGPISTSVLNVGQQMVPVLAIRVQAQYSDIDVQTVTLDLGNNTSFFNKIFNKIYVTDSSGVLTSQPLNSTTVVQSGSDYIIGLAGFHSIVQKGTYKDIIIKADLNSSIDSSYILSSGSHYPTLVFGTGSIVAGGPATGWGIGLGTQGVRGVDGAGLNLYSQGSIVQALSINASLTDNAQANLSLDGTSVQASAVPVSNTSSGTYSNPPLNIFTFAVNAQNDTLHLHNVGIVLSVTSNGAPAGAGVTAAYLMRGSTLIQSASVVATANPSTFTATFSNIQDNTPSALIPVNTTVPFTVAVDVSGVTAGSLTITASTSLATTQIYNSIDSSALLVGTATGNSQIVSGLGPVFTLSGAPTISVVGTNNTGTTQSTSTVVAMYNLNIGAVGTDVYFGTTGSSSPAFLFNIIDNSGATIYSGYGQGTGGQVSNTGNISSPAVIIPTLATTFTNGAGTNSFKVTNGTTNPVNIGTISFQFDGKTLNGANLTTNKPYKVTLAGIRYLTIAGGYATSTFMNGLSNWTTSTVNP